MWLILLYPGIAFAYCNKLLTVDISDGTVNNSTLITKYGVHFGIKDYYNENGRILGCVCEIKNCLRKCCEYGYGMVGRDCSISPNNLTYTFYDLKQPILFNKTNDLFIIRNKSCENSSYKKIFLEGKSYLQKNGSIYGFDIASGVPEKYKMYNPEEYCLDLVYLTDENSEESWEPKVFLCVEVREKEVAEHTQNIIGMCIFLVNYNFCSLITILSSFIYLQL